MDNLFFERKAIEQDEIKNREIDLLRDSLADNRQDFKNILFLKRHFLQGGKYHHVLQAWAKDLDAIFDLAERRLK